MLSSQILEHFHFLRPWWSLLLLPTLALLARQWRHREESAWESVITPHLLRALRIRQFRNHWFNPVSVGVVFMLLLTLILMGPTWRQQPSPLTRDEATLVILLDVSSSMRQRDIQPSRLQRARQKIADLLKLRSGSRTALVVFAGSAHTVLTATDDNGILTQYLNAIEPGVMPRSGKFAEYALPLVDDIVGADTVPTTVLMVTDGVASETSSVFTEFFSQRDHQLLIWGIGSTADTPQGSAPLEQQALRKLARETGGHYQPLHIERTDVQHIQRRINAHYVVTDADAVPWLDSGYWLVFPCLAIFSLWFRRGWTLHWSLPPLLALCLWQPQQAQAADNGFADLWLTPDQQGRLLLQQGRYRRAAGRFTDPFWKATAYYYAGDFKLSAEYFSRVDTVAAHFNRANALAQGRHYVTAVRVYEQVLKREPAHEGAAKNRDIVREIIAAINRMSESQADEGDSNASRELGDDQPQRADGTERKLLRPPELVQFDAEQILQDEKINAMWMRSIRKDPSHFLAVKFGMQLHRREQSP